MGNLYRSSNVLDTGRHCRPFGNAAQRFRKTCTLIQTIFRQGQIEIVTSVEKKKRCEVAELAVLEPSSITTRKRRGQTSTLHLPRVTPSRRSFLVVVGLAAARLDEQAMPALRRMRALETSFGSLHNRSGRRADSRSC
jgi:hypothetical protein